MRLLACSSAVVSLLALAGGASATPRSTIRLDGTVTLKVMKTKACKATRYGAGSNLACSDVGTYRGAPNSAKASYAWRWTTTGKVTSEVGNLGLNLGHGLLYLRLKGTLKTVGKPTTNKGVARTTGTVRFFKGTFAYKGKKASGTYTLDLVRNATAYRTLKLTVHAVVR
ncbi:MAG: hypothetical protein QOE36_1402 [Gaiellaceae bacterium]|jgi:hypothetical protein|nr:hypothetical protein [Gaiellaceae bacterium]